MLKHIATLLWNSRRNGVLLTLQIFLAFVVLFGVISFTVANFASYATPLGFNVQESYLAEIDLPDGIDTAQLPALYRRIREEVSVISGVEAVSMIGNITPFSDNNWGYGTDEGGVRIWSRILMADEHFPDATEVNIQEGRWYTPTDTIGGRWSVVVNQAFMDENFPGGRSLDSSLAWFENSTMIVGVVDNFKYLGEFTVEEPLTFIPHMPKMWNDNDEFMLTNLVVRTAPGTPASIEEDIYNTISEVSKGRESIVMALEQERVRTSRSSWVPIIALLTICAFLVANVALGLFGILINAIAKRRGEIGLRKAMGATGLNITAQFTLEVVLIALLGITLGSLVAVQIPLFELIELETRYFWWGGVLAAALILVIVLLCALIPSSQAARVHAAVALREE